MSQIHPFPQAKWIWPRHTLYLHNSYAGFRRDFTLKKLPSAAPLVITADQAYKLHVNGRYVCRGPARSVQEHWFFDVPDILPFLKTGHNWLAVEAHNPGMNTYSYVHRGAAGMLCSADWDDGTQFWSDTKDWIIFRNTAYAPDTARVSVQLGCMEELDLRFDDRSWITEEKDFRLPPAMPGISGAAMRQDALPWTELHPRPVSMLEEKILAPERITCSGTGACARLPLRAPGQIVSTTADFIDLEFGTIDWDPTPLAFSRDDGGLSFTLPAAGQGRFAVASLDLGADDWLPGVPVLELGEHDPGTVLDIFYDQWMKGGKLNFPLHPAKGCLIAMASRLHLNGTTRRTELFQIMGV
ncbi:MAG: hypothetical protein IJU70_07855, partial [Lentisphaeria bacterium]|nr:hypothetical protein [Lentisphaeria bacterium]